MSTRHRSDYYKILQVDPSAEPEVIKAAYKNLAKKYHDDHNKSKDAHERMVELNEAYECLSDPIRRAEYDRERLAGAGASPRSGDSSDPPRPIVNPRHLDFGAIEKGEIASKRLTVDNGGGPASELNFNFAKDGGPFRVANVARALVDRPFPRIVTIEASALGLSIGQSYSNYLEVDLDGVTDSALLEFSVCEPAADPWASASHSTATSPHTASSSGTPTSGGTFSAHVSVSASPGPTKTGMTKGWAIALGCIAGFIFAQMAGPIAVRTLQAAVTHPPDWLIALGAFWICTCSIVVGVVVTSTLMKKGKRAGKVTALGVLATLGLAVVVYVSASNPASRSNLGDAETAIPKVVNQIYSALNDGRVRDATPFLSKEIAGNSQSLDYLCRPSEYRAHYVLSISALQDGSYLVRDRALFKPFTERARLLWFKYSGAGYFLYAARDDAFTQEVETATDTVRQFIYAARAGKWDVVRRYASPQLPVNELKLPEWQSYLSRIGSVQIQRYIYNPEIRRIDRGSVRNDAGIIEINVHATLEGHNWFPDFLIDPTTGKIVKAFYPERMGMYTNTTGAPTPDGITDPCIDRDALKRFGLVADGEASAASVVGSQERVAPPTTESTGPLAAARQSIPAVVSRIYSALDSARLNDAGPLLSADILKNPETLDFLCQPFTYRGHYVVSVVEQADGSFLARVRALFKPFREGAYTLFFKESEGGFVLYRVETDPLTQEREAAVDAVRQFILASHSGDWETVRRNSSPHLPIDEMKAPEWERYLSRIEHADGDGQVTVNSGHGGITLGLRFGVRNFQDPDFLVDPATGKIIRAFFKIGTNFTNLSSPPNDSGISDPDIDEYTLARFGLEPNTASKEESFRITTKQGEVTVRDFTKNAAFITQDGKTVAVVNSGKYSIVFYRPDQSFAISLLAKPFPIVRQEAERALLSTLNISEQDACKLSVYEGIPISVDQRYPGVNSPLSFCDGSLDFQ